MKYQPNKLLIGNNRTTNHVIVGFLNDILKSQGRFRGTWSQGFSSIPTQSFSVHQFQHVLWWCSATLGEAPSEAGTRRVMFCWIFFFHSYLLYLQSMFNTNQFHKTRNYEGSRHNYANLKQIFNNTKNANIKVGSFAA